MRTELLDVLVCPECPARAPLAADPSAVSGGRIEAGELRCTHCDASYPVEKGVPRVLSKQHSRNVQSAFGSQWKFRRQGHLAEEEGIVFGADNRARAKLVARVMIGDKSKGIFVEGGCGTGDVLAQLATDHPDLYFVGMDFTNQIDHCAESHAAIPNIDWLQGDVGNPPFRQGSLDGATSWGVLHCTKVTRDAFNALGKTVRDGGGYYVWLYPVPSETPYRIKWSLYYAVRDYLFLGKGHQLPAKVLLLMVKILCAPFRLAGKSTYQTAVFIMYDCITPEFQHRHSRAEVESWYREEGFEVVREEPFRGGTGGTRRGSTADTA